MLDFEIQRCTRRCAKTDRELQPGETFYSVLQMQGADVVRADFCEAAWDGPPEDAVGWWKSKMPEPSAKKMHWAPNDVMLHYFVELAESTDKQDVRYVLALLMIRRRILRLEETESDLEGREVMVLYCPRDETQHRVVVTDPTAEQIEAIQNELVTLLFADAA